MFVLAQLVGGAAGVGTVALIVPHVSAAAAGAYPEPDPLEQSS